MGTLLEELARTKLVSPETIRLEEERRAQETTRVLHKKNSEIVSDRKRNPVFGQLEKATSASEFKDIARKHLAEYPGDVTEVIRLAHLIPEENGGRKKLIWLCYQVRDGLKSIKTAEERNVFLRKAFRKAGAQITPTE